ncbi:MAG: DUF3261 domain-containing protein [Pseudomonadota bacterium]
MRHRLRYFSVLLVLLLAACTTVQPVPARLGLKLAPAALGQAINLQQHLTVERNGRVDELDAALEVDADHLEMVGLAFGQRVLSLHYDGKELKTWRHALLPEQVRAEDVLEDLQLTMWPIDSIVQALPSGWKIEDDGLQRRLYLDDVVVLKIEYSGLPRWSGTVKLENLRYKYSLTIQSVVVDS